MILIFWTDRSGQRMQTQRSSHIRVFTVCYSICVFLQNILGFSNFLFEFLVDYSKVLWRPEVYVWT